VRTSRILKIVAVGLPLALTTLLWGLSKAMDETALAGLSIDGAIAQLAGLYSVVLMCIGLVITARSSIVEGIYGGLDKSYRLHRRLGEVALTLAAVHLIALIPATRNLITLIVPFTASWWKTVGALAVWGFIVFGILAFWNNLPYQLWLSIHKWVGIPFLLAAVHTFFASSDVLGFEPLRTWMLFCVLLGAGAWIYRTFIYKAAGPRYDYVVDGVSTRGNETWDLVLRPTTVRMNYEPGKFAFISVKNAPGLPAEHHPFSISSSPVGRDLRFSYKVLGDYTRALGSVGKGAAVEVYGPFGQFTLHQLGEFRRLVWIAGGIGITPFLSMLAFETTNDDFRRIWLFYTVKKDEDAVYHAEIEEQVSSADSYIDYVKWVSSERGTISADKIIETTGPIDDYAIMICGPPAMARGLRRQFLARGFRPDRIVYEDFAFR
jgi:predicted ferric reductase